MLFRIWVCLTKKSLQAVRVDAIYPLKNSKTSQQPYSDEKVSRCTSEQGSLTLEASLAFPIFLFTVTALLYLFFLLWLQVGVNRALTDAARELAQAAYLTDNQEDWVISTEAMLYGRYYIGKRLEKYIEEGPLKKGIQGISFLGSKWDTEKSELTLRVSYRVWLPPGLNNFRPVYITQTKTVRGWTGFAGRGKTEGLINENLVYVTEYGRVYHQRLDCRHLKLSIQQVLRKELPKLRNQAGARYYACEYCGEKEQTCVYITEEGNRFHTTLHCQGLTRGIYTKRISEVFGMDSCSACGE